MNVCDSSLTNSVRLKLVVIAFLFVSTFILVLLSESLLLQKFNIIFMKKLGFSPLNTIYADIVRVTERRTYICMNSQNYQCMKSTSNSIFMTKLCLSPLNTLYADKIKMTVRKTYICMNSQNDQCMKSTFKIKMLCKLGTCY